MNKLKTQYRVDIDPSGTFDAPFGSLKVGQSIEFFATEQEALASVRDTLSAYQITRESLSEDGEEEFDILHARGALSR